LIKNPCVRFFVERKPKGAPGKWDTAGQLINGVMNITRTRNSNEPVWSPIEKQKYENYLAGDTSNQDELAKQIVFMLYRLYCSNSGKTEALSNKKEFSGSRKKQK